MALIRTVPDPWFIFSIANKDNSGLRSVRGPEVDNNLTVKPLDCQGCYMKPNDINLISLVKTIQISQKYLSIFVPASQQPQPVDQTKKKITVEVVSSGWKLLLPNIKNVSYSSSQGSKLSHDIFVTMK